jgi:hypothetical protein
LFGHEPHAWYSTVQRTAHTNAHLAYNRTHVKPWCMCHRTHTWLNNLQRTSGIQHTTHTCATHVQPCRSQLEYTIRKTPFVRHTTHTCHTTCPCRSVYTAHWCAKTTHTGHTAYNMLGLIEFEVRQPRADLCRAHIVRFRAFVPSAAQFACQPMRIPLLCGSARTHGTGMGAGCASAPQKK